LGQTGPSSVSGAKPPLDPQFGLAMTDEDIQGVIHGFAASARNAMSV
jgi:2,4-dienoyl-CoA reductase-like NADH-dependent reductase (Old Yellow Enzyme family)